ncbi:hypothetical protein J5N97_000760 [Dioscorea zingiberensis]|uniref:Uncharacterized protein n=1 Tax=Dioscorea zingiberensis TaxID=325984 RepID=A0A9D5H2Q3_9LILI|nr:hypothetical protein J5N97_000760 [Dioscorea zingiberensis]
MQSDWRYLTGNGSPSHGYEVGGYNHLGDGGTYGAFAAPSFGPAVPAGRHDFPGPLMNGFEFQPMETCPKNFIIFDQTDNKSRVMFHPALAHKFCYPSSNIDPSLPHEIGKSHDNTIDNQGKLSSTMKEDTEEINALLSSEEEEEDGVEEDDDVISTGHTPCNWSSSPRHSSSSMAGSTSQKSKSSPSAQSSFSSNASSGRKRERMRKMVKALRKSYLVVNS